MIVRKKIGVISALIGLAFLGYAYLSTVHPPYISIGEDTITPKVVRVYGTITVSRNYEITRFEPMFILRTMVRGDCRANCEIVDLQSGHLSLPPGVYRNVVRDQVIPSGAQPGHWVLRYSVQWQDRFGRTLTAPLPPLAVEVIE